MTAMSNAGMDDSLLRICEHAFKSVGTVKFKYNPNGRSSKDPMIKLITSTGFTYTYPTQ